MKFVQYNALNYYSANQQLAEIVSQSHLNAMYLKIVLLKAFAHSKYTHTGVFTSVPWLDLYVGTNLRLYSVLLLMLCGTNFTFILVTGRETCVASDSQHSHNNLY